MPTLFGHMVHRLSGYASRFIQHEQYQLFISWCDFDVDIRKRSRREESRVYVGKIAERTATCLWQSASWARSQYSNASDSPNESLAATPNNPRTIVEPTPSGDRVAID
jgi:hypothetical protein